MSHGPPTPAPVTSIPSATAAVSTRGEQKVWNIKDWLVGHRSVCAVR